MTDIPTSAYVFIVLVTLWLVLLTPFYRLAEASIRVRHPEHSPRLVHNIAFTMAALWPLAMIFAVSRAAFKRV